MARGGRFYDDPEVFERYALKRDASAFDPNHVMEEPAVLAELGDCTGKRVVDLGCGDAGFGADLLNAGASSYLGVDGSRAMVERARANLADTGGQVVLGDLEDFTALPGSADLVVSRLALHYVENVQPVIASVARCLAPGGRFIVTVVHPIITSHDNHPSGARTSWTVDEYFHPGPRCRSWLGGQAVWYHRTVEQYVSAVLGTGLRLTALRECEPDATRCLNETGELARRRRVPLYLLLRADRSS